MNRRRFVLICIAAGTAAAIAASISPARAEYASSERIPELAPVSLCAYEVGASLQPTYDSSGPTLSQQLTRAVHEKCPLDALKKAVIAGRALFADTTYDEDGLPFSIAFAIRKSGWRGYYARNPRTYAVPREGVDDWGRSYITVNVRPPWLGVEEFVSVQIDTLRREDNRTAQRSKLHGIMDGYGYSRDFDSGGVGWGRQSDNEHFSVSCSRYNAPNNLCTIEAWTFGGYSYRRAFTAVFDGNVGTSLRLCAAGFDGRPGPNEPAVVGLTIDGRDIPLQTKWGCAEDPTGSLMALVESARLITSRTRFDDEQIPRVYATTGSGFDVARKLMLRLIDSSHLGAERAMLERAFGYAEQHTPRTVDEFATSTYSWDAAAGCVAAATDPATQCARILDSASDDWPESGKEWVTVGHERYGFMSAPKVDIEDLDPTPAPAGVWTNPTYAKKIAALREEASRRRAGIYPSYPYRILLGANEYPTTIASHPARAGSTYDGSYAYRLAQGSAVAVLNRLVQLRKDIRSVAIECEATAAPSCAVHVPFEDAPGELVIRTDGQMWKSRICLGADNIPDGPLVIASEYQHWFIPLNDEHCADQFDSGHFLAWGNDFVLIAGSGKDRRKVAWAASSNLAVAFELARVLSDKLKAY